MSRSIMDKHLSNDLSVMELKKSIFTDSLYSSQELIKSGLLCAQSPFAIRKKGKKSASYSLESYTSH